MVMTSDPTRPSEPIAQLRTHQGVLAVIVGVEGPSYRPLGALMALFADGTRVGSLSSGCIEADLILHARDCAQHGRPVRLRYGRGSPFKDIVLPCGGGLEILLVPAPDPAVLGSLDQLRHARKPAALVIAATSGAIELAKPRPTGWEDDNFVVLIEPEIAFFVFGKGPEASTFAALAQSAGFDNLLLSPDRETLELAKAAGCATRHLRQMHFPEDLPADARSAVVLFFHDHEWEPPILAGALKTPAFYIGAQGSQRARDLRHMELTALGASEGDIGRLKGPIGLVRSARDARTLAVSVLAEVLEAANAP